MLIKKTFMNDDDMNNFFEQNPNIYLIKMIVLKTGVYTREIHVVFTKNSKFKGSDHLHKERAKIAAKNIGIHEVGSDA